MSQITEHQRTTLPLMPVERLGVADIGTVMHVYHDGAAFAVEFYSLTGKTVRASFPVRGSR